MLHEPELLLLDEPTSAVDPQSRREFWDSLFELADAGTTLLVSTHYMDEAERCHRLAILDRGRLVADGTPPELMRDTARAALAARRDATRRARRSTRCAGCRASSRVAQIGTRCACWPNAAQIEPQLGARCARPASRRECSRVPPNLEDVFVAATREARVDTAAA